MTVTKVGASGSALLAARRFTASEWLSGGPHRFTVRATDSLDGSAVILKFERPVGQLGSLLLEYAQLRRLSHPHIARVVDVGQVPSDSQLSISVDEEERPLAGLVFLATADVGRTTIASASLRGDSNEARLEHLINVASGLAEALAYLHGRHLIHGDVAPANVAIDPLGKAVLIDFGLSGAARVGGKGQGTAGFAAPEALTGLISERSDLFGLGATLYFAWTRQPPFGEGTVGVVRLLTGRPPTSPSSLVPGLPVWLDQLILSLVAPSPANRPASAKDVIRTIRRWTSGSEDQRLLSSLTTNIQPSLGDPLSGIFVGRSDERIQIVDHLNRLALSDSKHSALVLNGLPGSGRHCLWAQAFSEFQLSSIPRNRATVDVIQAETLLADVPLPKISDPGRFAASRRAQLLEAAESRAARGPLCVLVPEEFSGAPQTADEWASWLQLLSRLRQGTCSFVFFARAAISSSKSNAILHIPVEPLSPEEVEALCLAAGLPTHDKPLIDSIITGSSGHAATAAMMVRAKRAGAATSIVAFTAPSDYLKHDLLSLPENALNAVLASWWRIEEDDESLDRSKVVLDVEDACKRGWLRNSGSGRAELPKGVQTDVLWGAIPAGLNNAVVALSQTALSRLAQDEPLRAEALRIQGRFDEAFDVFVAAAQKAWAQGDYRQAEVQWKRADSLESAGVFSDDDVVHRAQSLAMAGRHLNAIEWIERQPRSSSITTDVRRAETIAWVSRRQGNLMLASHTLEAAQARLTAATASAEQQWAFARLSAQRARLAVAAGNHQVALSLTEGVVNPDLDTRRLLLETRALACAYLGLPAESSLAIHEIEELQGATNSPLFEDISPLAPPGDESDGRFGTICGIAAQFQHDMVGAERAYAAAITAYERLGDVHGHANARLNQGMALAEQGRYKEALNAFARAFDDLLRVGAYGDATAAAFNAGWLFARLGDAPAVAAARLRLKQAAGSIDAPAVSAWLESLCANESWYHCDFVISAQRHTKAALLFEANGDPLHAALSWLSCSQAWSGAGQLDAAVQAHSKAGGSVERNALPRLWAGARLVLGGAALENPTLASELKDRAFEEATKNLRPNVFQSAILAARLFEKSGDVASGESCVALAARMQEEIKLNTPIENQKAIESDPDAAWLARWRSQGAGQSNNNAALLEIAEKMSLAQSRLRRFVRLSKRINSELRLPRLLETVLDTIIELTEAERGFVLLRDAQGSLVVRAARNIDQTTLEGESLAFSRSIAEQVASSGTPVITVDAAGDARFRQALSVSDLQLRSVVAVPLTLRGKVEGTIYVDNRLRQGAFGETDVATLLDFAELAAMAVGNARLVADLQRRDRHIETLNRKLEKELAARKDEISSMRVELSDSRESFALRFDYKNIIGRSPRMMELLRLLDRVSETNLPVVIQGESGTGKELVARALVANGPRKDKPFITENCAAIPETLLESTLFGYNRGAFTGADRDTRGLFSVANEGTLFLDEVGEMSPGLQGKLLRVLQEGEYRRVGGQRTEKTDVRIIVATNKDLQTMVKDGQFRQDLFFRLAVVRVQLPPLRERSEDIPLLVRHFLDVWKDKPGVRAQRVSSDALARLCGYRWPGNIRELENELARATAFSGETIEVTDLSSQIAAQGIGSSGEGGSQILDDLDLKNRVERLEKGLLREALSKFDGNQTRAAAALGLSRFGLQKKLKRYGFASSP